MTTGVGRQPMGSCDIGGKPFFLARDPQTGAPMWHDRQIATQEGDPTVGARFRWNDWSRGMGDSRGVFRGAIESATNAFLGMIGRILPGPALSSIATGHDLAVTALVEVTAPASRIISFGGQSGKEIDPSNHTVATTKDFGAGKTVLGAQVFEGNVAVALGDAVQFQWRSTAGVYAASTTTTDGSGDYRYARCFGLSPEGDLVRGHGAKWSKCSAADFYATNGNWSADYELGDATGNINQVGNFERWDYAMKDEGLYTFDQTTSKETNVLPDLAAFRSSENKRWFTWFNRLFLCTFAGLYRYLQQGGARTVGAEEMELNEGLLLNSYPTAGVAFGKWAYVAYYDGTNTYICMMRNARDGDASFGSPFTLVSTIDSFAGKCNAMLISAASGAPRVYYGRDTAVGHFAVTRDGRPASYAAGTITVTFSPTDLGAPMTVKYGRGLEVYGRNASVARAFQFAASWDGGGFNNVGAGITSLSTGFAQRFWTLGANDSGRVLQLKLTMGADNAAIPPELRDLVLNYEERPSMVPGAVAFFRLRDEDSEGDVSTRMSALEQRQYLEALLDGTPVSFTDPYGTTYTAAFAGYARPLKEGAGDLDYQYPDRMPQETIGLTIRSLAYA